MTVEDNVWSSGQWRPIHQSVSSIDEIPCTRQMQEWEDGEMREDGYRNIFVSIPLPPWLRERLQQQPLTSHDLERYLEERRGRPR